jgi:hypothetical protein
MSQKAVIFIGTLVQDIEIRDNIESREHVAALIIG